MVFTVCRELDLYRDSPALGFSVCLDIFGVVKRRPRDLGGAKGFILEAFVDALDFLLTYS